MKLIIFFFAFYIFLLFPNYSIGQGIDNVSVAENIIEYNSQEKISDKIKAAFKIVDKYIKVDYDDSAQNWIYKLIELNGKEPNDTTNYFIFSRQTEIFYYSNLLQFGLGSSEKAITIATKMKDSILIADGLAFKGYILEALDSLTASKNATNSARKFYPKIIPKYETSLIEYAQIINQLGQIYLKLGNVDSAYYFNSKSFDLAISSNKIKRNQRALNMSLRTFGDIYLMKKDIEKAKNYYNQCDKECLVNDNYDIILLNMGKRIVMHKSNAEQCNKILYQALAMADQRKVSPYFQKLFFKDVLDVFKQQKNTIALSKIQDRIIKNTSNVSENGNKQIQAISDKFVESENALLRSSLSELQNKKLLSKFQLALIALFSIATLAIIYLIYRTRKAKFLNLLHENEVLQNERNRIARDMHDDLGSALTRINYITLKGIQGIPTIEDLQSIKTISTNMVENMKEIIWTLTEDNNSVDELIFYIKDYTTNYCIENNLVLKSEIDEINDNFKIKGQNRRHIFLTIKEVLHNIVKHSNAKNVFLKINFRHSDWSINIKDDGKGFDKNLNPNFGNGLKNMQKRIESVNGKIDWKTNNGLEIEFLLPKKIG